MAPRQRSPQKLATAIVHEAFAPLAEFGTYIDTFETSGRFAQLCGLLGSRAVEAGTNTGLMPGEQESQAFHAIEQELSEETRKLLHRYDDSKNADALVHAEAGYLLGLEVGRRLGPIVRSR